MTSHICFCAISPPFLDTPSTAIDESELLDVALSTLKIKAEFVVEIGEDDRISRHTTIIPDGTYRSKTYEFCPCVADRIIQAAKEQGMTFLRESAVAKVLAGVSTLKEINKVTFID